MGAIVFRDGAVLLVKRAAEPNAARWSLPGGLLEIGETVEAAAVRETFEETRVRVRPVRLFDVSDFIRMEAGRIRWHYVLIDLLCEYIAGEPFPETDALNARFIPLQDLGEYDVTETTLDIVRRTSTIREVSRRDQSGPRAQVSVSLVPFSTLEYGEFVRAQILEFADQKVRAGQWRPEDAESLSRHVVEGFLPSAGPMPGHRVSKAVDGQGSRVGWVWVGPPPVKGLTVPHQRWLYQITVELAFRNRGIGRAMLDALERALLEEGVQELILNVFRWNVAARSLYDSAGYEVIHEGETDVNLRKVLRKREE
ncbi:MAG: GNAT family N-acetyltransferase [Thermoplasmata archaeon]